MARFYEFINHTADIGIRVSGKTKEELFINAARAVIDIILGPEVEKGKGATLSKNVSIESIDIGELFVKWLQEILYLFEVKRLIAGVIRIRSLTEKRLMAEIEAWPYDPRVHEVRREIKAVTYHRLSVEELADHTWRAEVIFDI